MKSKKFIILSGERKTFVFIATIVRIEGKGCYSRIYTADHQSYLIARNLAHLASRLTDFLRVHKSHLVNPDYVSSKRVMRHIEKPSNRYLRLYNGEKVPVSRRISLI